MADRFSTYGDSLLAPSTRQYPIVPHDTNEVAEYPKGIYVGSGGQVTLRSVNSDVDVVYKNLGPGSYIAVRARFVRATGTTATDMIAEA